MRYLLVTLPILSRFTPTGRYPVLVEGNDLYKFLFDRLLNLPSSPKNSWEDWSWGTKLMKAPFERYKYVAEVISILKVKEGRYLKQEGFWYRSRSKWTNHKTFQTETSVGGVFETLQMIWESKDLVWSLDGFFS